MGSRLASLLIAQTIVETFRKALAGIGGYGE
jgi:hypothetical protein